MATNATGDIASLTVTELPSPEPGPGEVRVRVHAAALNAADAKVLDGLMVARFLHAKSFPLVVGYDFSGVVDAVGSDVTSLRVADPVYGHLAYSGRTRQGTLAEQVTIDAACVAKKPDELGHDVAAAAATVGLTALQALRDHARLTSGQRVMVIGASGGVGSLAVGVAKHLGAHVTGVCSTYAVDFVDGLGADEVIDRRKTDPFVGDHSFDVVFDTTGSYAYGDCAAILGPGGTFVTTLPSLGFVLGKLRTLLSSQRTALVVVESRREDLDALSEMIGAGLKVPIAERFPLRDVSAALKAMVAGKLLGKVVVNVEGGL